MFSLIRAERRSDKYTKDYLSLVIDEIPLDLYLSKKMNDYKYEGLLPSWISLENNSEQKYIWDLLDNEVDMINMPILLCPDDMDFSCFIVVVNLVYDGDVVHWKKIGVVNWGNYDLQKWRDSGINDITKWTESDWGKYGESLALLSKDSVEWERWWSDNWQDEELRRVWNYYHLYFNNDDNINWLPIDGLMFEKTAYAECIKIFRCEINNK